METKIAVLLLLAAACGSLALPPGTTGNRVRRVTGGRNAGEEEAPYQARVVYEEKSMFCGGTIVHPSYVLTARHCLKEHPVEVSAGSVRAGAGAVVRRAVRRTVLFPKDETERRQWLPEDALDADEERRPRGDVALLELASPFPTDTTTVLRPVPLRLNRGYVGGDCLLSGWGLTKVNGSAAEHLQVGRVEVFPREHCQSMEKRLKVDHLCAGRRGGGVDACDGDSGGPLVCEGLLTGVVVGGRGCGETENVSKYTEVALYARWIAHVIGLDVPRIGYYWFHDDAADQS